MKIIYPIVYAFFYVLSLLPFWALYGISYCLYLTNSIAPTTRPCLSM